MKQHRVLSGLLALLLAVSLPALAATTPSGKDFWLFETGQSRPLALSPDGSKLFAVNTPDNRLEIFTVEPSGLTLLTSVLVGLEPIAVAARSDSEIWVVNHLSDSVSIINVSGNSAEVVRTLLVGDEPSDIVFAGVPAAPGAPFPRAFITTAHRGQANDPGPGGEKYGDFFTSSTGRSDVWVFDANNLGAGLGGDAETIVTLFGDTPRALAVTADGSSVYAAVFHSGNQTTVVPPEDALVVFSSYTNFGGTPAPADIVAYDGSQWVNPDGIPEPRITLELPDYDVFAIDATAAVPVETDRFANVGTIIYAMTVDPSTGKLYISNTEANNLTRFEAVIDGNIHRSQITVIDALGTVAPRHINKHIDYNVSPAPLSTQDKSLATPLSMVIAADGQLYVSAFGSAKIGVFSTASLDADSFVPDAANHIDVTGGGPTGIILNAAGDRLYTLTRFDNGISVIDRGSHTEIAHVTLFNPEPASVVAGRPLLYDARLTSSNGEASCSSCHVFGNMDDLSWNLGDPSGSVELNLNPFFNGALPFGVPQFHPVKGPMTTQSFRGMDNHGPMHWRGDRTGTTTGGDAMDEDAAFKAFNPAFVGLLGRTTQLSNSEMQAFTDFALQLQYPPNPIRHLDNSLTTSEALGQTMFSTPNVAGGINSCINCHVLDEQAGSFGTAGFTTFEIAPQDMKVPHLRNIYQKVGMFGGVATDINFLIPVSTPSDGPPGLPQVRGFGYGHVGMIDSVQSFAGISALSYPGDRATAIAGVADFVRTFPTGLQPIVGQQVTLTSTNGGTVGARIDLLIARAQTPYSTLLSPLQMECDLVVLGTINGSPRGWLFDTTATNFIPDHRDESPLTDTELRALAAQGAALTYTCAPPGSGPRIALDRDSDTVPNFEEVAIGTNPSNADSDGDTILDSIDNCPLTANLDQLDVGGLAGSPDGIGNACQCGDVSGDGQINNLDAVFLRRFLLGLRLRPQASVDTDFCDVSGDGVCNYLDAIFIQRAVFSLPPGIQQSCAAVTL
ncbi:MAG: dockerin type I domain-containing protein [Pseudomonadales bacterium]